MFIKVLKDFQISTYILMNSSNKPNNYKSGQKDKNKFIEIQIDKQRN